MLYAKEIERSISESTHTDNEIVAIGGLSEVQFWK